MGNSSPQSVDDYIASQPEAVRATLRTVRAAIRKALPKAEETISYQIPTYRLHGTYVVYFAAWKKHYSLYPVPGPVAAPLERDLARYQISKGTIRFPLDEPVPVRLIERLSRLLAARAKARSVRMGSRTKAHK